MSENEMSARHARIHFRSTEHWILYILKAMKSIGNNCWYALTFDMVMRSWNREGDYWDIDDVIWGQKVTCLQKIVKMWVFTNIACYNNHFQQEIWIQHNL